MTAGARRFDVAVVGGGNAGLSAALAAAQGGARVVVLEKAPQEWGGGNSYFTAGAMRTTFSGLADLRPILTGLSEERAGRVELDAYTESDFLADLRRVTGGRCAPELAEVAVGESRAALDWLHEAGVEFELMFHRQAYEVDGRFRFWAGLAVGALGGGKGLIAAETAAAERAGVEIRFESPVRALCRGASGEIDGVLVDGERPERLAVSSVVLAAGGFEADPRMRAAYLGPGWDLARVRGTPYNTGDGIQMALDAGAQPYGHWSGCHAVAWDAAAGEFGDLELTNQLTRGGYPYGIVVNRNGERFLDEGADYRNFTYARYGGEILRQPGGVAAQIFDATTAPLLREEEYAAPGVSRIEADTLAELAHGLQIDPDRLAQTVQEFNAAIVDAPFDPTVKDGRHTIGITPPKSNWSVPIERPPYLGFPVTCGITFTFGGLRVDPDARVLDDAGRPIPGLYGAGELVGGLYYHNYPGGSGLTFGTVFGRRAGAGAAERSRI